MKKRDNEKKKKDSVNFFWAKLETKEEAEKVIKDSFWFFLIIAIMIGILYVVVFGYYLAVFEALLLLFFCIYGKDY